MVKSIGFIGTGQMALALASRFAKATTTLSMPLYGHDPDSKASERFASLTGGTMVESTERLIQASDIVFLAVKPQIMPSVLGKIGEMRRKDSADCQRLWITIAAGIPIKTYLEDLGAAARLVRVMPNTPCLVGEGASGYCASSETSEDDIALAGSLLETVGLAVRIPESQFDALTGLSGSGPAYGYMMIEAMADGGVKMGLPRDLALKLAAQTLLGAAKLVLYSGDHPGLLKDRVCSPLGTTIHAVHQLERHGFRAALIDAVQAAAERSQELGNR